MKGKEQNHNGKTSRENPETYLGTRQNVFIKFRKIEKELMTIRTARAYRSTTV